ncbi:hypothetical protein SEVIR_5G058750v4 [Setaria viridis]
MLLAPCVRARVVPAAGKSGWLAKEGAGERRAEARNRNVASSKARTGNSTPPDHHHPGLPRGLYSSRAASSKASSLLAAGTAIPSSPPMQRHILTCLATSGLGASIGRRRLQVGSP